MVWWHWHLAAELDTSVVCNCKSFIHITFRFNGAVLVNYIINYSARLFPVQNKYLSNPFSLSLSYCMYQGSFFTNPCQHFFNCNMFCPTDILHPSPYPHFKSLQSFYVFFPHSPCLWSIQHDTPCVFIIRFLSFPLRKIHWNTNEDMKLLTQHGECLWWIDPKQFYHWRMRWIHLLWTTLPSYVPLLQKELRLIPVHQGLPQNTPNIIQTTILWHSFKHHIIKKPQQYKMS